MKAAWRCPKCKRAFSRKNQRHACGTGERAEILRNRSDDLVRVYAAIEKFAKSLGPIEIVTRQRYALFRSVRIFADLVVMTDAVRVAIHLGRKPADPIFFKQVEGDRFVTSVVKLRSAAEVGAIKPYLKEAYAFSLQDKAGRSAT